MGGGRAAEREIREEGLQDGAPGGDGARIMKPLGKLVRTYLLFPPPVPEILAGAGLHADLEKDRAPDLDTPKTHGHRGVLSEFCPRTLPLGERVGDDWDFRGHRAG